MSHQPPSLPIPPSTDGKSAFIAGLDECAAILQDVQARLSEQSNRYSSSSSSPSVLPSASMLAHARNTLAPELPDKGDADATDDHSPGLQNTLKSLDPMLSHVMNEIVPALPHSSLSSTYFGFITGGSTPAALAGDVLCSVFDQNVQVHLPRESIATILESVTLDWLRQLFRLPEDDWGLRALKGGMGTFTTGATASNVVGLAMGREWVVRAAMRKGGLDEGLGSIGEVGILDACAGAGIRRIQVLSTMPHSSMIKAAGVVGIGRASFVDIAADSGGLDVDLDKLEVEAAKPGVANILAVSAGEVNTGHFATRNTKQWEDIQRICTKYDVWIHVDGAFGLFGRLFDPEIDDEEFKAILDGSGGLEYADSITGDGHKLLNVPYDCGFFFCRHRNLADKVFSNGNVAYLKSSVGEGDPVPSPLNNGLENSRRFRALPVYASLKAYGRQGYQEMLRKQTRFARKIAHWLLRHDSYKLLAGEKEGDKERLQRVFMIVLFRAKSKDLNESLVELIKGSGKLYVSGTMWEGQPACRLAVSNWRTDLDLDYEIVTKVLDEIVSTPRLVKPMNFQSFVDAFVLPQQPQLGFGESILQLVYFMTSTNDVKGENEPLKCSSWSPRDLMEEPESDLQRYLRESTSENGNEIPPPLTSPTSTNGDSLFNHALSRKTSIFSFSREPFSNQLASLTSLKLPKPETLANKIKAIPTAAEATKTFPRAAEQISRWTQQAVTTLSGLSAEDDIEWAAAGGRGALDEVDKAVNDFEALVLVYVQSIEDLQGRPDITDVDPQDLKAVVEQMEKTMNDWDGVRKLLKSVHEQVELAMEWEELEGTVLGDVKKEMLELNKQVAEMEEARKSAATAEAERAKTDTQEGVDISELETIVEENPAAKKNARNRFSLPAISAPSPTTPTPNAPADSDLLALFARMQPLRASLDFLPMRLSMFQGRASKLFPSACTELKDTLKSLERDWKQLEKDSETLRKELEEDRWVIVFRNAGRQASKMCESVERSMAKLQEALDADLQHTSPPQFWKKVESFEAKKQHYGPAIDRVLGIILKGIKDRLTVNAEIMRLRADLMARTHDLREQMDEMSAAVEDLAVTRTMHLRDSVSSIMSTDRTTTGSAYDTPGSSPASSVIGTPQTKPHTSSASRRSSSIARPTSSLNKRLSSLPQPRKSSISSAGLASPSSSVSRSSVTPTPGGRPGASPLNNKPRWSSSTNTNDLIVGHHFKPHSTTTPAHHSKSSVPVRTPRSVSSYSSLPLRSPLSRETSSSPAPSASSAVRRGSHASVATPTASKLKPPSRSGSSLLDPVPYSKVDRSSVTTKSSSTAGAYRPPPRAPSALTNPRVRPTPSHPPRPASAAAPRPASAIRSASASATTPKPKATPLSSTTPNKQAPKPKTPATDESTRVQKIEYQSSSEDEDFLPDPVPPTDSLPSPAFSSPPMPTPPQTRHPSTSNIGSSPLAGRKPSGPARPPSGLARPGSRVGGAIGNAGAGIGDKKGKRMSMLPMPKSGRESATGDRPAWR
ncbi:MAG: hypothetical protein Q9227_004969 [Pyrenula ochraceoflavens]